MTCIVGLAERGRIYLGADSVVSDGESRHYVSASPKLASWPDRGWVMGLAGDWAAITVIRDELIPPSEPGRLYREITRLLAGHGLGDADWEAIAGAGGRLYRLSSGAWYDEVPRVSRRRRTARAWTGCGTGGAYALGALSALADADLTPHQLLEEALEVAARHAPGVGPPWVFAEG